MILKALAVRETYFVHPTAPQKSQRLFKAAFLPLDLPGNAPCARVIHFTGMPALSFFKAPKKSVPSYVRGVNFVSKSVCRFFLS